MAYLITVLLLVFVAYLIWNGNQGSWQFRVDVVPNQKTQVKGFPGAKIATVQEFFRNDIRFDGPVTVFAAKDESGRVQTKFRGNLNTGQKQRIRNFLIDVL